DQWMEYYNNERPHSGRYCFGKTPMATFLESLPLAKEKILHENFTEENPNPIKIKNTLTVR
ncbi:MAG: IS481 family transposase, partial [Bacteroidota bacterium]